MVQISHNTAKNGIELTTPDKLSDTTLRGIKSLGFSWSKYQKIWYATYSPQLLEKIEQLLGVSAVNTTTTTTTETPKAAAPKEATKTTEPIQESKNAKAFFKTAESLQKKADAIYKNCSTKLTNTRKRMDEYNHAISQADTLAEKSKMYAAMGKAWENDNVPEVLKNITPIASVNAFSGYTKPGYNTYGSTEKRGYEYKTGAELEKAKKIFAAITALMNNANPKNEKEEQEKAKNIEIKKLENEVKFQKIDGFFPTPKTICNQMVELADIQPNDTILEPSAGIGSIAEAIRENYPNNKLDVCEWMYNLREILTLKGFNVVGEDTFKLKGKYDVIIMNPPFEKGADIDHVTFCYNNLLAPGGKLVAIMGEGAFSRSAKHDKDFQSWYVDVLEYEKKLDGNTFKGIEAFKQTGVNTRLIVLQKEGTKAKTTPKEQLPLGKRGRKEAYNFLTNFTTKHTKKTPKTPTKTASTATNGTTYKYDPKTKSFFGKRGHNSATTKHIQKVPLKDAKNAPKGVLLVTPYTYDSLEQFELDLTNSKVEILAAYRTGRQVYYKVGTLGYVDLSDMEPSMLIDSIITHNHPSSTATLSDNDVNICLSYGAKAIRAVTPNYVQQITVNGNEYSIFGETYQRKVYFTPFPNSHLTNTGKKLQFNVKEVFKNILEHTQDLINANPENIIIFGTQYAVRKNWSEKQKFQYETKTAEIAKIAFTAAFQRYCIGITYEGMKRADSYRTEPITTNTPIAAYNTYPNMIPKPQTQLTQIANTYTFKFSTRDEVNMFIASCRREDKSAFLFLYNAPGKANITTILPLKRVKEIASTNDYSTTKIKDTIAINNIRGKGRKKITNNTRTKHKPLTPIRQGATTNPIPQASKYNTVEKSDITAIKGLLQSTAVPVAPNAIYEYKKIKTKQPEIKGEGSITGDKLLGEYAKANVYLVPLHDISINRALFQNREAAFSQRTVTNITDAVHNGEFHLEVMDPLLLWRTKINGKIVMYILAGHSRYQSFGVLNQEGAKVKGFDFSTIPCRILDGVSAGGVDEKTAMYLARISNNLATPETTTERVEYYQSLLKAKTDPKEVMKEIKKNEDKNATAIKNLVHLNPKGKTYQAYQQLGTGTGTNEAQVKNIATMIGNVRASNPNLTNQHEDEMWDYLYTKKKYGTQSSQINSVTELKDKVDRAAKSAGIEKDSSKPLNIANLKEISDTEREYQKEKKGALDALNQAEKERRDKQLKYSLDLAVEKKKQQNAKKERGENTRLTDTEEKALDEKYRKAMAPSWQKIDGLARIYRDVLLRGADVERLAKMENAMFA